MQLGQNVMYCVGFNELASQSNLHSIGVLQSGFICRSKGLNCVSLMILIICTPNPQIPTDFCDQFLSVLDFSPESN